MKYFLNIVLFLFITISCVAQEDVQSKIKYYTEKVQNYLDKEKALSGYYSIDKDGIKMFASSKDKLANKVEFFVSWRLYDTFAEKTHIYSDKELINIYFQTSEFTLRPREYPDGVYTKPYDEPHPKLFGYRIAIDAGHIANDYEMGDLEKKYIKMNVDSARGIYDSLQIAEGMLTMATAQLLKEKLEAEGAQTFSTRVNGLNAFGISFDDWLTKYYATAVDSLYKLGRFTLKQKEWLLGPKALKRDKFREVFKDLELAKRAEIINKYNPDFTVIIHYNVDETNLEWNKPTTKNFNMTFVGGAFMKSDLATIEKRFDFFRLLITDDLEKSIQLSGAVVKQFENTLNVKTAKITDAKYLFKGCLPTTETGVYCRNLQLPRFIHSPIVYGETLYQDNLSECKLLNEESDKTKNKRVQQVADAYYKGIVDYIVTPSKK